MAYTPPSFRQRFPGRPRDGGDRFTPRGLLLRLFAAADRAHRDLDRADDPAHVVMMPRAAPKPGSPPHARTARLLPRQLHQSADALAWFLDRVDGRSHSHRARERNAGARRGFRIRGPSCGAADNGGETALTNQQARSRYGCGNRRSEATKHVARRMPWRAYQPSFE